MSDPIEQQAQIRLPWWHEPFDRSKHKSVRVSVEMMESLDRVDDELVAALERCEDLAAERDEALEALREVRDQLIALRARPNIPAAVSYADLSEVIRTARLALSARVQEEKHRG